MRVNVGCTPTPDLQQGVGLLEVLIALLLLAIAALGYSALQGQSIQSTDESLTRTQAITLLRDAAESMRANALGATYILKLTPTTTTAVPDSKAILEEYKKNFDADQIPNAITCNTTKGCTPAQTAVNDVRETRLNAKLYDIKIGTSVCPGTANKGDTICLIAAWKTTEPEVEGSSSDYCMKANGAYRTDADCIYMEAY